MRKDENMKKNYLFVKLNLLNCDMFKFKTKILKGAIFVPQV